VLFETFRKGVLRGAFFICAGVIGKASAYHLTFARAIVTTLRKLADGQLLA
jgi:hypothetical protein